MVRRIKLICKTKYPNVNSNEHAGSFDDIHVIKLDHFDDLFKITLYNLTTTTTFKSNELIWMSEKGYIFHRYLNTTSFNKYLPFDILITICFYFMIRWLPFGFHLSRTNLRSSGQSYTWEAPDSSFGPRCDHHWWIFSISPRLWTRTS